MNLWILSPVVNDDGVRRAAIQLLPDLERPPKVGIDEHGNPYTCHYRYSVASGITCCSSHALSYVSGAGFSSLVLDPRCLNVLECEGWYDDDLMHRTRLRDHWPEPEGRARFRRLIREFGGVESDLSDYTQIWRFIDRLGSCFMPGFSVHNTFVGNFNGSNS